MDQNFIKGPGADGFIRVVAVQTDGKVLLGGNLSNVRGAQSPLVARLNQDGTPDPGFASPFPTPVLASRVYTIAQQGDGRLVVGGLFTDVGGTFRTNIARLGTNGLLDTSFSAGAGPSGLVRIIALQPDGKILIGGEFTTVNNTPRNRIARLNTNGSLDMSFDPGTGADDIVRTVVRLPSGQVLVGGLFTHFAGVPAPYLVRLSDTGSLDNSFPVGGPPNNNVYYIDPLSDGTLLIGGDFTAVNGTNINRVARLNLDGSLDNSFTPPGGVVGGAVYHILVQENGKIVIGGAFTSVTGVALNRLATLNHDGSLDNSFNIGTGPNDMILSLALQSNGMVLAGGLFNTYNGTTVGMFARIFGDPGTPALVVEAIGPGQLAISWPASDASFNLQETDTLQPPAWQTLTNLPTLQSNRLVVPLLKDKQAAFFRLFR